MAPRSTYTLSYLSMTVRAWEEATLVPHIHTLRVLWFIIFSNEGGFESINYAGGGKVEVGVSAGRRGKKSISALSSSEGLRARNVILGDTFSVQSSFRRRKRSARESDESGFIVHSLKFRLLLIIYRLWLMGNGGIGIVILLLRKRGACRERGWWIFFARRENTFVRTHRVLIIYVLGRVRFRLQLTNLSCIVLTPPATRRLKSFRSWF